MIVTTEIITPVLAAKYLGKNAPYQRKISERSVSHYANIIRSGNWTDDATGIAFDKQGYLVNGQHRLHAVIKTGISIEAIVIRNFSADAVKNIDTNYQRNLAAATGLPRKVTDATSFFISLMNGREKVPPYLCEEYFFAFPEIDELLEISSVHVQVFSSAPVRSAAIIQKIRGNKSAFKNYAHLTKHSQDAPPVVHSFRTAVLRGTVEVRNRETLFKKAFTVFDDEKQHFKRLAMDEQAIDITKEIIRNRLSQFKK